MKRNSEYIGVDEKYIPENEKYVKDSALGNREKTNKIAKRFGIGYLCLFGIMLIIVLSGFVFVGKQMINFNNPNSSFELTSFNSKFEMRSGTNPKLFVASLLDDVVTNNKTNNNKIIKVIYEGTITSDPNKIITLKQSLEQGKDYEVVLDYDLNGFVNQITISKAETEKNQAMEEAQNQIDKMQSTMNSMMDQFLNN